MWVLVATAPRVSTLRLLRSVRTSPLRSYTKGAAGTSPRTYGAGRILRWLISPTAFLVGVAIARTPQDQNKSSQSLQETPSLSQQAVPHLSRAGLADGWKGQAYPALNLAAATKKLKSGEGTISLIPKRATDAAVCHFTSVASNNPSEDRYSYDLVNAADSEPWHVWGVYDGHAGWATSQVLREQLPEYVACKLRQERTKSQTWSPAAIDYAIKDACLQLDSEIMSDGIQAMDASVAHAEALSRIAPARAGSCALLAVFSPADAVLRVACVGDSRAVLGRRLQRQDAETAPSVQDTWKAEPLSIDQTGFNESEVRRIDHAHPGEPDAIDHKTGRLLGLAITRAFGDHRWKWFGDQVVQCQNGFFGPSPRPKYLSPPYLTAEPVVTTTKVEAGDFLILASDGLWDHMSSEDAVECVSGWVQAFGRRQGSSTTTTPKLTTQSILPSESAKPTIGFGAEFRSTPDQFVTEDDNAATPLIRNAFGGNRRDLFCSVMTLQAPESRNIRDDVTVQVIFFGDASAAQSCESHS